MPEINFCKFHGFGNDYVVIDNSELKDPEMLPELAKSMCRRNTGIGSDGIALIGQSDEPDADFECRIINPDGSEAGFSGNGTRCAVASLYFRDLWSDDDLKLKTKSGVKNYRFLRKEGNKFWFLAELGKPKFTSADIPFLADSVGAKLDTVVDQPLSVGVRNILVTCINVGNPVCVVFVDDFDFSWRKVGYGIETHQQFPERTNVVFVKVLEREELEIKIWERGAGETTSSGTCSIAAAVASAFTGRSEREVAVHAPGGTTKAVWRDDDEMLIEGSAELVYCGQWIGVPDGE